MAGGDKGLVCRPADRQRFGDNIAVAAGLADSLGCRALNALYGNRPLDVPVDEQDQLALENLVRAAHAAAGIGAVVLIEALNAPEAPQYGLLSSADAVAVVDAVNEVTGLGNARFLADLYHLARGGEDPAKAIDAYADRLGHVQVADSPGRGYPGSGSLDFPALLGRLDAVGYTGYIGLEYKAQPDVDNFAWLPRELRHSAREKL